MRTAKGNITSYTIEQMRSNSLIRNNKEKGLRKWWIGDVLASLQMFMIKKKSIKISTFESKVYWPTMKIRQ